MFRFTSILLSTFIALSLVQCKADDTESEVDPNQIIIIPPDTIQYKYEVKNSIYYYGERIKKNDDYKHNKCVLDIYYPLNKKNFSTIVWIHGGGLTSGDKSMPRALQNRGFAVISIEYRLSPKVRCPAYIEDAAAAVAWVVRNINNLGGDSTRVFVVGASAGAYLSMIIAMDKKWLAKYDIDADRLAGYFSLSGQLVTHSTIRAERGIPESQIVIDEFAPLFHIRENTPPIHLFTGDRAKEMNNRYNENLNFLTQMRQLGNNNITLIEFKGFDHGTMVDVAIPYVIKYIREQEIILTGRLELRAL